MKKIVSLFQRNYDGDRLARNEVVPGAEWVLAGEGTATRKWDGTCCMVRDGLLYKRYDAKHGKKPPADFEPAQDPDPKTGHWPGWIPVGEGPEDRWHREAWANDNLPDRPLPDDTYELVGPRVRGNPELGAGVTACLDHHLFTHGGLELVDAPRGFAGLRAYFTQHEIEGIVWHHPDGRMVKIKRGDFGLPWPVKEGL